jgi:hypothetical protein
VRRGEKKLLAIAIDYGGHAELIGYDRQKIEIFIRKLPSGFSSLRPRADGELRKKGQRAGRRQGRAGA